LVGDNIAIIYHRFFWLKTKLAGINFKELKIKKEKRE